MNSITISNSLANKLADTLARQVRTEVEVCRDLGKQRGVYYHILCQQVRELIACGGRNRKHVRDLFRSSFRAIRSVNGGAR
jgi:hypothetical protein